MLKRKYKSGVLLSMFMVLLFLVLVVNFNFTNNLGEIYGKYMFYVMHIGF